MVTGPRWINEALFYWGGFSVPVFRIRFGLRTVSDSVSVGFDFLVRLKIMAPIGQRIRAVLYLGCFQFLVCPDTPANCPSQRCRIDVVPFSRSSPSPQLNLSICRMPRGKFGRTERWVVSAFGKRSKIY